MNFTALPTGLVAIVGDEQTGKTTLLRQISGDLPHAHTHANALWLDLNLPSLDAQTPLQIWDEFRAKHTEWQNDWQDDLVETLQLTPHLHKQLFMLSAGSRRKVALIAMFCSGAQVTCIDQPYVALDQASISVIREFLIDMTDHPTRTWIVADYGADPALPWKKVVSLTRTV